MVFEGKILYRGVDLFDKVEGYKTSDKKIRFTLDGCSLIKYDDEEYNKVLASKFVPKFFTEVDVKRLNLNTNYEIPILHLDGTLIDSNEVANGSEVMVACKVTDDGRIYPKAIKVTKLKQKNDTNFDLGIIAELFE